MVINDEKEFFNSLLREDFKSFLMKVFSEIAPNSEYSDNWHIDVMCNEIEEILSGSKKKQIINIPPRSLKSMIFSIALPAYILWKNPKAVIICVSYSDTLASKFALDTRRVMESEWYKEAFPLTRISPHKRATNDFETTRKGGRYATSVEGTLTGRGADYIIIDDPIKPDDTNSDLVREKVNNWYSSTVYSRLNDKKSGKILVVMQRIHQNDFTGYLLEADKEFSLLKLPAIAETDEEWIVKNSITNRKTIYRRKTGEALHPAREDLDMLNTTKTTVGSYVFASQYQQNPVSRGSSIIKPEWLQYYKYDDLFNMAKRGWVKSIYISWDTAHKIDEENDYSACVVMAKTKDGKLLLVEVYRDKLEFPALLKKIKELREAIFEKFKYVHGCPPHIVIEEAGAGYSLMQALENEGIRTKGVHVDKDKATRLKNVSHLIENGTCLFPDKKLPWWDDFERELFGFPNTKHDDQCDAFSQALAHSTVEPNFDE